MTTLSRLSMFSILAFTISLSTGCMVTPYTGQLLKTRSETVEFSGYSRYPEDTVKIWARNSATGQWGLIGTTKSRTTKTSMYGGDWYYWSKKLSVPAQYWTEPSSVLKASAILKATIGPDDLYCFEEGFYDYFDDYDNVLDLWEEHGRGQMVWIASEQ